MKINTKDYLKYKFFNSLFLGISVGSIFTIYSALKPSIYSLGGIFLALFMIIIAKYYHKILNINYFYKISMLVEIVILLFISYFLIFSYSYTTALLVYIGYQITFVFGSYLIRAETMLLKKGKIMSFIDISKQKGYLLGMLISYFIYKYFELFTSITNSQSQVYYLHYFLLLIELLTIYYLKKAFNK